MAPHLTLYRASKGCSIVPHMLLNELKIPFSTVLMTFGPNGVESADGSLSHGDYRKIHPAGYVPALKVDDEILTENPAILTYIGSLAPDRRVFGKDDWKTAKIYQWLCWLSGTLHGYGYAMILRPGRFSSDAAAQAGIIQQGRNKIAECYAQIELGLRGEHAVGDEFTVVDANLYIFWVWGQWHGFHMLENYPKYGKLVRVLERMESVRKTLKAEELPLQFAEES